MQVEKKKKKGSSMNIEDWDIYKKKGEGYYDCIIIMGNDGMNYYLFLMLMPMVIDFSNTICTTTHHPWECFMVLYTQYTFMAFSSMGWKFLHTCLRHWNIPKSYRWIMTSGYKCHTAGINIQACHGIQMCRHWKCTCAYHMQSPTSFIISFNIKKNVAN